MTPTYALADIALARRLERAEGCANAAFVDARAAREPASGACWREIAGAYAMFDTVGSAITQTFGLGVFVEPTDDDLLEIERFFEERGAEVFHEVSPLAGLALLPRLSARGYRPIELTSVMHRPVALPDERADVAAASHNDVRVRRAGPADADVYADTAVRGWSSEGAELADIVRGYAALTSAAHGVHTFLAELEGRPVAAAALAMHGGVAVLAGASTVPESRGRGAQAALLAARLRAAADAGCDLAMMGALPGSASQRNAERAGFRIAYTRIKWGRSPASDAASPS